MEAFTFSILTPDTSLLEEGVESVVIPGEDGLFGILAGHAPMTASVAAGIVKFTRSNETSYLVVGDGILKAGDNRIVLLSDAYLTAMSLPDAEEKFERYAKLQQGPVPLIDGMCAEK